MGNGVHVDWQWLQSQRTMATKPSTYVEQLCGKIFDTTTLAHSTPTGKKGRNQERRPPLDPLKLAVIKGKMKGEK